MLLSFLVCLPILGIVAVFFLEDYKSTLSLKLDYFIVLCTLKSGKYQIIVKVLIVVIAFFWCSDPIQLDVDSDSGEALTSPTENVASSNQDERQSSPENTSGNNEEKEDNSEKYHVYQGIPKNELTQDEIYKRSYLEKDLGLYQGQAEYDKGMMDEEAERIKNNKEEAEGRLYRDIMPIARKQDGEEILNITKKLEEIRLKESPTDIGQLAKKRKAE
jgi:hypothetical protein